MVVNETDPTTRDVVYKVMLALAYYFAPATFDREKFDARIAQHSE